jgi:hypothetical protein
VYDKRVYRDGKCTVLFVGVLVVRVASYCLYSKAAVDILSDRVPKNLAKNDVVVRNSSSYNSSSNSIADY